MLSSEKTDLISAALVKAALKIKNPTKNKTAKVFSKRTNASYEFSYADLAACLEAVRGPYAEAGIALVQPCYVEAGKLYVQTMLIHESGQFIGCSYPVMTTDGASNQDIGGAITYGRRYGLVCLTGIVADDDDDANAADGNEAVIEEVTRQVKEHAEAVTGSPDARAQELERIEFQIADLSEVYKQAGKLDLFRTRYTKAGGSEIWPKGQEHIDQKDLGKARFLVRKLVELKKTDIDGGGA